MSDIDEGTYFEQLNNSNVDITLDGSFLDKEHKKLVISARGYIDAFNAREFGSAILQTIELVRPEIVIINLESVNYIASMGFGELVSLYKYAAQNNIDLKLYRVNPRVYDVLSMLGFAGFFTIIDNLSDHDKRNKIFPVDIKCPNCSVILRVPKAGSFKCKGCKNIIRINDRGKLTNED